MTSTLAVALLAAGAAADELTIAMPGVPPVFGSVVTYAAREQGFFKKRGVEVEVRAFDSGAAAAQAVVAGSLDASLSPTPVVVRMISNAGVDLVALYGMEHPDWLLVSTDAKAAKCQDVNGQAVGVDSVGGARSAALEQLIRPCGLKLDDVKLVSLSTNVGAAMVAGQLRYGVLHLDDLPVLDEQLRRPLAVVTSFQEVNPLSHYLVIVALRERVKQKREAYVRMLAGLIDATSFVLDPGNADKVAQVAATVTGRTPKQAKEILPRMVKIGLWPVGQDGLAKANLDAVIAVEKELGGIKPGKTPVSYEKLVDRTVWKDASALVMK
ncbi:MAG: ABC transporter substrate-binding protein [Deltaproteobacteria bacterium]|nr:MAG: ABC transporter substrate-binding protein [Deltaproteobacteria bacterium]